MKITIRAARVNKNLTQVEAAKRIGITTDALYNYENYRSYPNIRVVKKMTEVYDVPYDNLIFLPSDNDKTVIG